MTSFKISKELMHFLMQQRSSSAMRLVNQFADRAQKDSTEEEERT